MDRQAFFMRQCGGVHQWLDHAGFIVSRHQGNVGGTVQSSGEGGEIQPSAGIHRDGIHRSCQIFHTPEHRAVLDGGNHRSPLICQFIQRMQRRVHALGSAAGEDDFRRVRADQIRDLVAGVIDGFSRQFRPGIRTRGIRITVAKPRQHRIEHLRQQRSRRIRIKINHSRSILPRRPISIHKKTAAQNLPADFSSIAHRLIPRTIISPQVAAWRSHSIPNSWIFCSGDSSATQNRPISTSRLAR